MVNSNVVAAEKTASNTSCQLIAVMLCLGGLDIEGRSL